MALALFALILAVDQLTKYAISTVFLPGESLPVVPHIFHITYVLNPGAALACCRRRAGSSSSRQRR